MYLTVSLRFTFQNKSAWQPNKRRMFGRGGDGTEDYPAPSVLVRFLDSADTMVCSVFLNWPLLPTATLPRNVFVFRSVTFDASILPMFPHLYAHT